MQQQWIYDFSRGRLQPEKGWASTYYLAKICRKLHENEENWTRGVKNFTSSATVRLYGCGMELRYYFRICIVIESIRKQFGLKKRMLKSQVTSGVLKNQVKIRCCRSTCTDLSHANTNTPVNTW